MKQLVDLGIVVQEFLESHGLNFCFIGGLALQRWGENRFTGDVDLSVLTGFENEERVADLLLSRFAGRISGAKDHALRHRVLLLECDGIGIDVGFAGFDYEIEMMRRASAFEFLEGLWLRTCSAEDLVVMKAFASRPRDWEDIRGILIRQEGKLDWALILSALGPLAELKEDPAILPTLETLRRGEG